MLFKGGFGKNPHRVVVEMVQQGNEYPVPKKARSDPHRFEPEKPTWTSRLFWALFFVAAVAFCVGYFLLSTIGLW